MKTFKQILLILCLISFIASCSNYRYPLGKTAKRAYKKNLKEKRKAYKKFTPVKLPKDSLDGEQWTAPSPNFNIRKPDLVILHYTAQKSCETSLKTLTRSKTNRKVSAHYFICKNGTIYNMVDERYRAWQAGDSRWGNMDDINSVSLGIEIDNKGDEPFTKPQIHSLLILLKSIKSRYNISQGNFVGHADVAPTRRGDPGSHFPWDKLAEHGYGYQTDSILPEVPEQFDEMSALRLIGYDIRNEDAAKVAFKRHFIQKEEDPDPAFDAEDRKILYDIYLKYLNE